MCIHLNEKTEKEIEMEKGMFRGIVIGVFIGLLIFLNGFFIFDLYKQLNTVLANQNAIVQFLNQQKISPLPAVNEAKKK